jgi:hypothetical protein
MTNRPWADAPRPTKNEELLDRTKKLDDESADTDELLETIEEAVDSHQFDPGPISGLQHDLEHIESNTDRATTLHSSTDDMPFDPDDPSVPEATTSA